MAEPTPAEIEAGAREAHEVMRRELPAPHEVAAAVLRAVLPDHDARTWHTALTWAAQEIRDRLSIVAARDSLSYGDGASDAARLLDWLATDAAKPAIAARQHTTGEDT
jgi:hypothetical protein